MEERKHGANARELPSIFSDVKERSQEHDS